MQTVGASPRLCERETFGHDSKPSEPGPGSTLVKQPAPIWRRVPAADLSGGAEAHPAGRDAALALRVWGKSR